MRCLFIFDESVKLYGMGVFLLYTRIWFGINSSNLNNVYNINVFMEMKKRIESKQTGNLINTV